MKIVRWLLAVPVFLTLVWYGMTWGAPRIEDEAFPREWRRRIDHAGRWVTVWLLVGGASAFWVTAPPYYLACALPAGATLFFMLQWQLKMHRSLEFLPVLPGVTLEYVARKAFLHGWADLGGVGQVVEKG
jgi:hypothetical protein